jgi:WD40 repeat protein
MGVWRWLGGVVALAALAPAGCRRAQLAGMPDRDGGARLDVAPASPGATGAGGMSGGAPGPSRDGGPAADASAPPPASCPADVGRGSAGAPPPPAYLRACDAGLTPAASYTLVPDGAQRGYHHCGELGDVAGAVRLSRDGRRLAVVVAESVRLFDTTTWREIARVAHASEPIDAAALSPDGARLATSASYIGEVTLWDTSDGHALAVFPGTVAKSATSQLARGAGLAFSSDGRRIATSMGTIIDTTTGTSMDVANNQIRNGRNSDLWFTAGDTGLLARTMYHSGDSWSGVLIERFDAVTGVFQTGIGDIAALCGDLSQAVGVIDRYGTSNYSVSGIGLPTPTVELVLPLSMIPGVDWRYAAPVALSNHGDVLALSDGGSLLHLVETQHPAQELARIAPVAGTNVLGVSPADELVTSGPCGTIGWDWRSGRARWVQPFTAQTIAWTADGSVAVAAGPGALFRIWRADTGAALCAPPGGRDVTDRVFSGDGRSVLVRYDDGAAEVRDADLTNPRPVAPAAVGTATIATLANDGSAVAIWAEQPPASAGQTAPHRLEVRGLDGTLLGAGPIDASDRLYAATLSPDLTRALYASAGPRLVDTASGTLIAPGTLAGTVLGFSPDGARFALAVSDGIATFSSADGSAGPLMRPTGQPVLGGALSADWSVAVSSAPGDGGTEAVRWQTPDGPAQVLPGGLGQGTLTTDGALLIGTDLTWHEFSGDYYDTVVRDAATGALLQHFSDHRLTPSADGTRLFGDAGAVLCR